MSDGQDILDNASGERSLPIGDADIYALVRLLGKVAGMNAPINDRRRALLDGLCELVEADLWIWIHAQWQNASTNVPLNVLDAGWNSPEERNRLLEACARSDVAAAMLAGGLPTHHDTLIFDESHPGWAAGEVYRQYVEPFGLKQMVVSHYPLPNNVISGIGVHRRNGRPDFTERERAIMHLVLSQVDWLHRIDLPEIATNTPLAVLSNRERELLMHLLSGSGRKQIAAKMGLSEHTIGGYMKSLYRRLSVNSRGELMSRFLPAKTE